MKINIAGISKADVLKALWDGSHAQGMSFLGMMDGGLTIELARNLVDKLEKAGGRLYFDYVMGHVIKCDITGDEFDPTLYDRDCGEGRAEEVIEALRNGTEISDKASLDVDLARCIIDNILASKKYSDDTTKTTKGRQDNESAD